jgi:hypothetical protein
MIGMGKKLFTPVKFEKVQVGPPASENPVEVFPGRDKWTLVAMEIREDIEGIQNGMSDLVANAIQFPKGQCVPLIALDRFIQKPSRKYLEDFLALSLQDIGARAADHWKELANTVLSTEGVTNVL